MLDDRYNNSRAIIIAQNVTTKKVKIRLRRYDGRQPAPCEIVVKLLSIMLGYLGDMASLSPFLMYTTQATMYRIRILEALPGGNEWTKDDREEGVQNKF